MPVARVVNVGSFSYIETDLAVHNCKPSVRRGYGQIPILWRKMVNGVVQGGDANSYYLINGIRSGYAPLIAELGNGSTFSKLCGTEPSFVTNPRKSSYEYTTLKDNLGYSQGSSYNKILSPSMAEGGVTDARPDIRNRGVLTAAEGSTSIYIGNTGDLIYNISREDLLNRWKTYLSAAQNDPSRVDDTAIYFYTRGETAGVVNKEVQLKTIDDLISAFPRYFQYDEEFKRQALASITSGKATNQFFADNTWWPTSYLGLWDSLAQKEWIGEAEVEGYLLSTGEYSLEQIRAIRALKGTTAYAPRNGAGSTGTGGSGSTGGTTTGGARGGQGATGGVGPNRNPWLGPEGYAQGAIQNITVQRGRNLFLTSDEISSVLSAQNISLQPGQPVMYQIYLSNPINDQDSTSQSSIINQYVFGVAPNDISYSGFGGEWVTIERTGGFPFIDWKNFKLLQVSFSFVIANKNGPLTADGLESPVTDSINLLQRMAQTPFPVMFYGFDTLLTNQFRYDEQGTPRGIQFVIQDLSITATRRNSNMEITRAQASITLQEIPIERQSLIGMPRLTHKTTPPKEPPTAAPEDEWGTFTSQVAARNTNFVVVTD